MTKPSVIIIGSGIGGLGAAALLAKNNYDVTVFEKNEMVGGRASIFHVGQDQHGTWREQPAADPGGNSFSFDMGPSWYLMPDMFEHFFALLGEDVHQHLDLVRLDPNYRIFYKYGLPVTDIHASLAENFPLFERLEPGSSQKLRDYLTQAEYVYGIAKDSFMYKNYDTLRDFFTKRMMTEGRKLDVLTNMDRYVRKYFKSPELQKIMQYTLVFLGSSPYNTPSIYNIMGHIDFNLGVFYPKGGMYEIVKSLQRIGEKYSVKYHVNTPVEHIIVENGQARGVRLASGEEQRADIIISNTDIHHTEQQLLDAPYRTKSERYWQKRTLAPSGLLLYLGIKGTLPSLTHHNLLFSSDWKQNFAELFDDQQWPSDPSLYVCNPSTTDPTVAPPGYENLFVLVPIAPGLQYTPSQLNTYVDQTLQAIEQHMDIPDLRQRIVYQRVFCVDDFATRYNSYRGTALGLAQTLRQTAIFRPKNTSKKVKDLYYVGADTNPGIGVPITLISAELLYKRLTGDTSTGPLPTETTR